jgi:hypothetical protein
MSENLVDALLNVLLALVVIGVLAAKYAPVFVRSGSDAPRIKRDYEANGARVTSIEPAGIELGGRSSPSYRKYEIVVDHPFKGRRRCLVGVQASLLSSDLDLKLYRDRPY